MVRVAVGEKRMRSWGGEFSGGDGLGGGDELLEGRFWGFALGSGGLR